MKNYFQQDSLPTTPTKALPDTVKPADSLPVQKTSVSQSIETRLTPLNSLSPAKNADSIFNALERKRILFSRSLAEKPKEIEKKEKPPVTAILPNYLDMQDSLGLHYFKSRYGQESAVIFKPPVYNQSTDGISVSPPTTNISKTDTYPTDFFLSIIMLVAIVVIFVRTVFSRYFNGYIQMAFNYQLASNMLRDKNAFVSRFNFILNLVYITVLSIFMYQAVHFFDISANLEKLHFVYFLLFISALAMVRVILLKTLGEVFAVQKSFGEYLFNQFVFNKILGLTLIPLVFIIPYMNEFFRSVFLYLGIILIATTFLIKLVRGFTIIIKKDVLLFYVILYLCTLEILPVLVGLSYFKRLA